MAAERTAGGAGGRGNGRGGGASVPRKPAGVATARAQRPTQRPLETPSPAPIQQGDHGAPAGAEGVADLAPAPHVVAAQKMGAGERLGIGAGIVVVTLLLVTQLLAIWPAVIAASSTATPKPPLPRTPLLFGVAHTRFDADVVLIVMVLMVGATAALVAVSRRFLYFAMRDQLTQRDEWSYALRPFQGAVLALIVYFTLRGGFLGQDATSPVNPYGVAAISSLVGLFTRHAVSKLTDVFDTVFGKPKEEVEAVAVAPDRSSESADDGNG